VLIALLSVRTRTGDGWGHPDFTLSKPKPQIAFSLISRGPKFTASPFARGSLVPPQMTALRPSVLVALPNQVQTRVDVNDDTTVRDVLKELVKEHQVRGSHF
jgi:hypothetical protein